MFIKSWGYKWGFYLGSLHSPGNSASRNHTKPLSHDSSAWITVPVGTTCTSYSSSFSGQFHLSSSPSVSNYLCITRGPCHSSRFEGGSCHVISLGMLYTSVSRDKMLWLLTDAFVSLQTATQKWSICGREDLSILYFNYFLAAFLMPGRGFPQGDALIQFVLALRWSFQASQPGPKVIKSDMI